MDFKTMAFNLGIGEEDFRELVELLVTTSRADLDTLEQGLAAQDASRVADAAHSIKGAAGNMGFSVISARAAGMEASARAGDLDGVRDTIVAIREDLDALKQGLGL
jgi:HPt (histidine-containing phosphotransfer) domain-containing protein